MTHIHHQEQPPSDEEKYEAENQAMLEAYDAEEVSVVRDEEGRILQAVATYADGETEAAQLELTAPIELEGDSPPGWGRRHGRLSALGPLAGRIVVGLMIRKDRSIPGFVAYTRSRGKHVSGFEIAMAVVAGLFVFSFTYSIVRVVWRLRQGDTEVGNRIGSAGPS